MGKPNLKNMLLAIIGLMASAIFITKAIVPWMVNPVKEWERKATDRKNKINSLQKTQKTADLYRKRLAKAPLGQLLRWRQGWHGRLTPLDWTHPVATG